MTIRRELIDELHKRLDRLRAFFAGLVLLAVCWFQHIALRLQRSRDGFLLGGQGVLHQRSKG